MMNQTVTAKQTASKDMTKKLTVTAVFAAMITIMTAYIFHIPTGINQGYIHLGDALIYLAAASLPMPYACAAGAIGGGLADILTAPAWAPFTIVIKALICLGFSSKKAGIVNKRNIIAATGAMVITIVGYFLAEVLLYGSAAAAFISSATGNLIQGAGSLVLFLIVGKALDGIGFKKLV